jgi:hypothetical protein
MAARPVYRIKKNLQLDGKTYDRGAEAELELPGELEADLIGRSVIARIEPEQKPAPAERETKPKTGE